VTQVFGSTRRSLLQRDDIHVIAALAAVFAWGVGPIFNKLMTVSTPSIVFYRMIVGLPLMIAMAYLTGGGLTKELMKRTVFPGLLFSVSMITGFASMTMTSIANATLVTTLQPVLVLFVAPRIFGEKITGRQIGYSALSMVGVLTVVLSAASTSDAHLSGDLMAVTNVVIWTCYFVISKKRRVAGVHSWSYLAAIFTWASVVIFPFGIMASNDLGSMTTKDWWYIVAMALVPGLIGHGMMTWAQGHIDISLASLLGLLSPVVSAILAWIVLRQTLTSMQLVGGAIVLASLSALVRLQGSPAEAVIDHES